MASRFVETDEEFIKEPRNRSENKNTKKNMDYWTKIFQQWEKTRNLKAKKYPFAEINKALKVKIK